jgi:hypothetical protein
MIGFFSFSYLQKNSGSSLFKKMLFRKYFCYEVRIGEGFPATKRALPQETVRISLRSKDVSSFSSLLG